jgi:hypothetical protein
MNTWFAKLEAMNPYFCPGPSKDVPKIEVNHLKPTGYVMHQKV